MATETKANTRRARSPKGSEAFTSRAELADAVRSECVARLAKAGIVWGEIGQPFGVRVRASMARTPVPEGRGRPPGERARFVYQLERKDIIGAAGGPRGAACTKSELAMLWLLTFGCGDISAARVKHGMTAEEVIGAEAETMHQFQLAKRHGSPEIWVPARKGEPAKRIDRAPNGSKVPMRKLARKPRGHRPTR